MLMSGHAPLHTALQTGLEARTDTGSHEQVSAAMPTPAHGPRATGKKGPCSRPCGLQPGPGMGH